MAIKKHNTPKNHNPVEQNSGHRPPSLRTGTTDLDRRRTLKLLGASNAVLGTLLTTTSAHALAASATGLLSNPTGLTDNGRVAINIVSCKSVSHDWVVIENLGEQAVSIVEFRPGVINYLGKQLDLNAFLVRQDSTATSGDLSDDDLSRAIQVAADYAWSESSYGLSSRQSASGSAARLGNELLVSATSISSYGGDSSVIKCWADVHEGVATIYQHEPLPQIA